MEKGSRIPRLQKSSAKVFTKSSDLNKRKKVKFLDPIGSRESSGRQDLPSSRREGVQSPNDGDAKTSEFKNFKRLLGETDRKRCFNRMPEHDDNLKTFEASDCIRVKNDMDKNISETKRSLFPAQQVTPITQRPPSSAEISQSFELDNDSKDKDNKNSFLSPLRKVTSDRWRSCISPAETLLNCGPEHEYEGIFLKKRKKLLQLAAEASSPKVDGMLSNKSDLIQEFLQRLGNGRKSDDPVEHPKPGEKVFCSRYRAPTSLIAYGDNKSLQETVRADNQRSLGRKQEMGLLTERCSEADEQIALPVDHVKYQDLPNFHALEGGSVRHRWQSIPVSGDKRKSCLYAENKAASSIDLGWYQTARNMLSYDDELITLPEDYPMVHSFMTSNVFDSGLHGIQWHSNPNSVDEGVVDNKSASTRYFAMGHTVPKVDRSICLPRDRAELQSFPAWKSLDTDLEGRKWSSNSTYKGERISSNRSISTGYHMMDRLLSNDDEFITLPSDVMLQSVDEGIPENKSASTRYFAMGQTVPKVDRSICLPCDHAELQSFPAWKSLDTDLESRKWSSNSTYKGERISNNRSISTGYHMMDRLLSNDDEFITLPSDVMLQSVVEGIPENKSASTRYFAMGHTVPKADRSICLPRDHAELQSFPAWKSLDTDLEGRKWSSNSAFKGERISNNRSISTGYHMMDRLLSKDDGLITLPSDVMLQSVPARHATQTGPQGKSKHSIPVLGGISNLHTEMEFESGKCGFHSDENMLSNYGNWIPRNFPTGGQVKNYSIVPYFDSGSSSDLSGRDLYSELAKEQCSLPLLQWSRSIEPELPSHSAGEHSKGLDCLPLMLYGAPDKLDTTECLRGINACRGRNIFSSIPRYCHFSPPTSGIELEGNNLEHCWSIYTKSPWDKQLEDGGFACNAARNTYDDFEDA